jgi:cell division inhibitor SulA/protein ImuA
MAREYRLRKLLKNPHIWRPGDFAAAGRSNIPSGFAELDRQLGGGWPVGVLTEILLADPGIGELGLLLPALLRLGGSDLDQNDSAGATGYPIVAPEGSRPNRLAWIAPPYIPYAPALMQHGLDISRILIVRSARQADALWAMEQALRSSVCIAVLGWFTDVDDRSLRRLQLAAESTACWAVIFRPSRFTASTSPAPLRVHIKPGAKPAEDDLELQILRNRYGPVGSISLPC